MLVAGWLLTYAMSFSSLDSSSGQDDYDPSVES